MIGLKKYGVMTFVIVALLVALIFFLLNIPNNRAANMPERALQNTFAPVMKLATTTSNFFLNIWNGYINLADTRKDNVRMIQEIKELNTRVVTAEEALLENQRLKRLLDMRETIRESTVTALVIGEDMSSWFSSVTIDRGSSSGIREGMAVVAADGVVGQIVKVSSESSRVLLLTDHASGISATVQRSRTRGVVKGRGEKGCSFQFVTRDEDVQLGDQLIASGIGGMFPKGARIGEVSMVKRGEYGLFQTITVRPSVDFAHLEEVLVILRGKNE